ncbi:helix-turn-helix domain-containing protein [Planomicrobium sp. YIM 101495]|uniref:helix-turn-helix domain-containing protein n=1 Tax=Planomicrobium sp. YIM 101495 TaxID=2665160 RepID=UPI0012B95EB9|nr:helix-turn-helix transcriptional regulator [Planomicrobium sp. YIM 101495]MTD30194.1 helix-turn-helix domain-containing protein [Planomicrobium sp. YIM 101495]
MSLGRKIKQLRDREGYQQKDFATKLGVSNVVLSRYESDERKPDYDTLLKIADLFEVSVDYLLGRTEKTELNEDERTRNHYMSKISSEFPDMELMFDEMESLSAEDMQEVYEYIKFKKSQKR